MALTVQDDILYPSLRLAGVAGGPGRTPSPEQVADALQGLNTLIDAWSTLRGMVYTIVRAEYPLTTPKSFYSIGRAAGADFVADRPTRIESLNAVVGSGPSRTYQHIRMLDAGDWDRISGRDYYSTFPTECYADYASPNCLLYLRGIPTAAPSLEVSSWVQTSQLQSETDPVLVPPGYLDALVLNLAVRMADQFRVQLSPNVYADAKRALARVKALNTPSPAIASADFGTRSGPASDFSYLTGGLP